MADRTNPAGEKWKKGRKKKRPLPGTPAQALNEAAGVKTAGTGGGTVSYTHLTLPTN